MTNSPQYNPDWYQASTILERLALVRDGSPLTPGNEALAERRWTRWQAQAPFNESHRFEQRLALEEISSEQFRFLLGETAETIQSKLKKPPAWFTSFSDAFQNFLETPSGLPDILAQPLQTTFLAAAAPLIHRTYHLLWQDIQSRNLLSGPFDAQTFETIILADLPERLLSLITRTMVLELNVARIRGRLSGDSAEARFRSFLVWISRSENSLTLWQEYPSLARSVISYLDNWRAARVEFLQRLASDYDLLRETYSPGQTPGLVTGLESHMGDAHQNGRTVTAVTFQSGLRLVYKPRSVASSRHFQQLLHWLNEQNLRLSFKPLRVLEREHYGWIEYASAESCRTEGEVKNFYYRLGAFLALLYILRATDFHYQNVIAAGEHPLLIDLETFFQPPIGQKEGYSDSISHRTFLNSVIRIGLLPQRWAQWINSEPMIIDFSGMGGVAGQEYNKLIPRWDNVATDEMRMVHKQEQFEGAQNQPSLNGKLVNPLHYADQIVEGFQNMYQLLLENRDMLLANEGPLAAFLQDEMRIVLRSTMVYSMLLKDGRHPDLQRNALDRERHFDRLWVGIDHQPDLARVIPFERRDLQQEDIPFFVIRPNSRHLWNSQGDCIPNYFAQSGEALTRQRLEKMGPADLQRQLWFIRAALSTLTDQDSTEQVRYTVSADLQPMATPESLIASAKEIAGRLADLALTDEHEASWIGLSLNGENWILNPLGLDLYSGLPGVIVFLAYLGDLTGEEKYTALARKALNALLAEKAATQHWQKLIGGFSGWGGIIYALAHLGQLWQEPALFDAAEEIAAGLPDLIGQDPYYDIIAGSAGCIMALSALNKSRPNPQLLKTAVQAGDHLLKNAQPQANGLGWQGVIQKDAALTGFSHGTAGIALALIHLSAWSGEARFMEAALSALAYERSLFSPEAGNWPDLRPLPPGKSPFRTAWCHGAPGIGLARLGVLEYLDDDITRQEIAAAAGTTLAHGFGRNHSLCHGDLGNIELLFQAGKKLNQPGWLENGARHLAAFLADLDQHGPVCGVPWGMETPGLMNGLAGIGYGMLRLAAPERIPSILLLDPPPRK